jgi:aspartate/methionine/tyrosine aminotransferase
MFPRLPEVKDIDGFCRYLAERHGVFLLPGSCFDESTHVRIGFGGAESIVAEGLRRLSEALSKWGARRSPGPGGASS